jgi:hypothetical protein
LLYRIIIDKWSHVRSASELSTAEDKIHYLESRLAHSEVDEDAGRPSKLLDLALELGIVFFKNGQIHEADLVLQRVRSRMLELGRWDEIMPHVFVKTLHSVLDANEKGDDAFNLHVEAHHSIRRILGNDHL